MNIRDLKYLMNTSKMKIRGVMASKEVDPAKTALEFDAGCYEGGC
jgi:hypothetical protein